MESTPDDRISVSWPWTNEVFIFSHEGLHLESRSLFTDAPIISFHYDEEGRLAKIIDKQRSVIDFK